MKTKAKISIEILNAVKEDIVPYIKTLNHVCMTTCVQATKPALSLFVSIKPPR